jgi:hypothetical protein
MNDMSPLSRMSLEAHLDAEIEDLIAKQSGDGLDGSEQVRFQELVAKRARMMRPRSLRVVHAARLRTRALA